MTAKSNVETVGPWRALLSAHALVMDRLTSEMEEETGLPIGWHEVLLHLAESPDGRLRMHELADSMLSSRSALTRFVDRMELAGLVQRVSCPSDRRGLEVVATEAGRSMFRKAGRVHLRGIQEHFAQHLTSEEAASLEVMLKKVMTAGKVGEDDQAA
ncbi:MAG: MarR family transcriptional regulator [bacterium]|nr:MarR family transcriptional regulator [bacterium]